jgi:asparagine synthase (glutamine-hydrolysing)
MTDAMRHRGPDDAGEEIISQAEPAVLFGHRRLAIIDLSPAGHQPMCDPDTGTWITFNGEIYNYRELRNHLEKHGQTFRTQTDTETILKAYAVWGTACVHRLRGIFAFGLWDQQRRLLLLARDQLGVKPLYYWQDSTTLLFASEVRSLLASGLVVRRLNPQGLRSYLAYGSVQEPYTLVEGIQSLPPGHTLTWYRRKTAMQQYWHIPSPERVLDTPPTDVLHQVQQRLLEAVQLQLVADVSLGGFLSGGIDSTAIAALMRQATNSAVKTFSVVFDEKRYDERRYAQHAANHIGTEHTELLLRGEEVRQQLPAALAAFDQPGMDGLNTYFVSKITREAGLTVALSGVGGDELFGGYEGYRKPLLIERWSHYAHHIPHAIRPTLSDLVYRLPGGEQTRKAADLLRFQYHPYFLSRQLFGPRQVTNLLAPELSAASQRWEPAAWRRLEQTTQTYDPVNRASVLEMHTYMLSTLLRDTDQMSMAHALEVRVPLIDHVLVEYLLTLPGTCKVSSNHPKPLLTRSLDGALPQECVYRPKRGFELPFAIWLRESLHDEMEASFRSQSIATAAPFTPQGLEYLWSSFERGQVSWGRVWSLFTLQDWLRQHGIARML